MNSWRKKSHNSPTKADGDKGGCVLAWHIYNGCMVTGVKNARDSSFITHWQKLPLGPDGQDGIEQDRPAASAIKIWNPQTGALEARKDE